MSWELLLNLLGLSLQLFSPGRKDGNHACGPCSDSERGTRTRIETRSRYKIENTSTSDIPSTRLKRKSKPVRGLPIFVMGFLGFVTLSFLFRAEPLPVNTQSGIAGAQHIHVETTQPLEPKNMDTLDLPSSPMPLDASTPEFPQISCGDVWTKRNDTNMWPVYISDLTAIKVQESYCADAVSVKRNDTGVRAVQVASFFNEGRAKQFAQKVNGDVGLPVLLKKSQPSDFCGDDLRNKRLEAFAVVVESDLADIKRVCADAFLPEGENGAVQIALFSTRDRAKIFAKDWEGRVVDRPVDLEGN